MSYQGWMNAHTWLVALYFNNEKTLQDQALEACFNGESLLGLIRSHFKSISAMADWVQLDINQINIKEIDEHFKTKLMEVNR